MAINFTVNGRKVTEEQALNAWVEYDTNNAGSDRRESVAVFDQAQEQDQDGAIARDYLLDAGVEIFFSRTRSSYDA